MLTELPCTIKVAVGPKQEIVQGYIRDNGRKFVKVVFDWYGIRMSVEFHRKAVARAVSNGTPLSVV